MIEFVQFMRPDGRQVTNTIERPPEIEAKAGAIVGRGLRFEAEVLLDGTVSFTVSDGEEDIDIELAQNGPEVPLAVDRLIERVHKAKVRP
jgi:hypothetical protein